MLVHGVVGPEDLRTEEKLWYYFFLVHYNLPFVDDLRVIVDWTVVAWQIHPLARGIDLFDTRGMRGSAFTYRCVHHFFMDC